MRAKIKTIPLWIWKLVYLAAAAGFIWAAMRGWGYDDPFITFRYARNLAAGLGFVYNPGQQVLSTTTPLLALLLAAIAAPWQGAINIPQAANLIGALSLAAGGLMIWAMLHDHRAGSSLLLYPLFPLLLNTLGSEMALYLALCLGAWLAYSRRRYVLTALLLGLAVLARPDAILLAGVLGGDWLVGEMRSGRGRGQAERSYRGSLRSIMAALLAFLAVVGPWVVFAWLYFGSPLPATLFAKQQQGGMAISQRFAPGLFHILSGYPRYVFTWVEAGLAGLGLFALLDRRFPDPRRRSLALLFIWTLVYFAAYSWLGVSRYHWYYAPLSPAWIVLVGLGVDWIYRRFAMLKRTPAHPKAHAPDYGWAAGLAGLLLLAVLQASLLGLLPGQRRTVDPRLAVYRQVGDWLSSQVSDQSSIGALEVGIIGYYAMRTPGHLGAADLATPLMVDFAGLLQPEVAVQITRDSQYADTAQWAVEHYHPSYLALNGGAFPDLESGYAAKNCQRVRQMTGVFASALAVDIYACTPPAR